MVTLEPEASPARRRPERHTPGRSDGGRAKGCQGGVRGRGGRQVAAAGMRLPLVAVVPRRCCLELGITCPP